MQYTKTETKRCRVTGITTVTAKTFQRRTLWIDKLVAIETTYLNHCGHEILPNGMSKDVHGNLYSNSSVKPVM